MIFPVAVAGGVQLNVQVLPAPTEVIFAPGNVCSIYCSGAEGPQLRITLESLLSWVTLLQNTCVSPSTGVKLPASAVGSLADRAVSWKPQRRCFGSLTVTLICCVTPGVYVLPPALMATLPPPPLSAV